MPARDSSAWPTLTVVLSAVAIMSAAVVVPLIGGVNPNPFSFTTNNIFWLGIIWLTPAVFVLAAGASGAGRRVSGSEALRIAAAALTGFGLLIVLVIAVVQTIGQARPELRWETLLTLVSLVSAGVAVVLAFVALRGVGGRREPLAFLGLALLVAAQIVFDLGGQLQYWATLSGLVILREVVENLLPVVGVWLIAGAHKIAVWAGAGLLIVATALMVQSLISNQLHGRLGAIIAANCVQTVFFVAAVVTAVLAAAAVRRSAPPLPSAAR